MNLNFSPIKKTKFQRIITNKIVIKGKRKIRYFKNSSKKLKRRCCHVSHLFK